MNYFRLPLAFALFASSACFVAELALAQSPSPSPTPACELAEFRQFDFWLGKWKVTNPDGLEVGKSEVSRQAGGCAIREQWSASSGQAGMSINYYDAAEHSWHQDWVGGDGTILHLRGGLKGDAMVLSSEDGKTTNRITWTPLPDKKVRQEWEVSADKGTTWQKVFSGLYSPASP